MLEAFFAPRCAFHLCDCRRSDGHVLSQMHVTGCIWVPTRAVHAAAIARLIEQPWDRDKPDPVDESVASTPSPTGLIDQVLDGNRRGKATERYRPNPHAGPVDHVRWPLESPGFDSARRRFDAK